MLSTFSFGVLEGMQMFKQFKQFIPSQGLSQKDEIEKLHEIVPKGQFVFN